MTEEKTKELYDLFKEAEICIKETEYTNVEGFYLPAVNELRYSLKHLIDYLKNQNNDDFVECKAHISRAMLDALEVRVVFVLEKIRRFRRLYTFVSIPKVINNWSDILNELEDTRLLLSLEGDESRATKLKNAIDKLEKILRTTENAKPELNKILFSGFFKLLGGIIAFLASLIVIYNFILCCII